MSNLIPPLTEEGSPCPFVCPEIFPGVRGYAVKDGDKINIPWIEAVKEGNGDVSKFLDALDPKCRIVNVISSRLCRILKHKNWKCYMEATDDGPIDVWIKP